MTKRRQGRMAKTRRGCTAMRKGFRPNKPAPIVSVRAYAQRVWESIDTPVSLSCYLLSRNGEWEQLVRKGIDPAHYVAPDDFWLDYQAVKLLSKCPGLDTGIDTARVAYAKFIECEQLCSETNANFSVGRFPPWAGRVYSILDRARDKILSILGVVPELEKLDFTFGPGANYGVRGDTSSYSKLHSTLECTRTLLPLLPDFLGEFPGWIDGCEADVSIVQGSELTLVPKDAKTDRPICIEPLLNGLGQKGIGAYLKGRLLRHGIDLRDQSINQRLAAEAYSRGLATVDFSSASDTISYTLVWSLLPTAWAEFLDHFRCPRYQVDETWYNFQKYSSMGNAYTFELETLIFYSLASATMQELGIRPQAGFNVSVYGDDVIIPREAFDLYQQVCEVAGFRVNQDKSFHHGSFFESCGGDYFQGHLVTPFRVKSTLDQPEAIYLLANNCVRMVERLYELPRERLSLSGGSLHDQSRRTRRCAQGLSDCHRWLCGLLRSEWRVFGPASTRPGFTPDLEMGDFLGDTHIWSPWDHACPRVRAWGYAYRMVVPISRSLIPWPWLENWDAYEAKLYPHAGYALYKVRGAKAPINGWLTNDEPWMGNVEGYTTRGNVGRKRIRVWASDWSFPECCWGLFFQ